VGAGRIVQTGPHGKPWPGMRAGGGRTASRRPVRAENSAISAVKLPVRPTQAAVTTFDPSGVMTGLNRPVVPAGSLSAGTIRRVQVVYLPVTSIVTDRGGAVVWQ
jgi:hypothetical protein